MSAAIPQPQPDAVMHDESQSNDSSNLLAPTIIEHSPPPASQHPPARDGLDQSSHVGLLATCGVAVRDFAYENTLPPVRAVPRFSVQTQPKVRPLKRTRDMLDRTADEESDVEDPSIPRTWYIDSNGTGVSRPSRYRKRTQALARTLTEPADEVPPSQGLNTREGGFTIPSSRPMSPGPSQGVPWPTTPHKPHREAQTTSLSPLAISSNVSPSQPSQQEQGESQESWIDTPLVTPNGSLQWPLPAIQNTSTMPASQLESVLPQLPAEDDVTLSQLGFSPARSQAQSQRPAAPGSSPAGTPSRRRQDPQLPPPAEFRRPTPSSSASPPPPGSPPRSSPGQDTRPGSPRYHFRERAPAAANANGKKPAATSRARAPSRTRTAAQSARKTTTENSAPPARKKQKPSPPADLPGRTTRYGQRKNTNVEGVR